MEFSRSFPSLTFAVLSVDQSVERGVKQAVMTTESPTATFLEELVHQFSNLLEKSKASLHRRRSLRN